MNKGRFRSNDYVEVTDKIRMMIKEAIPIAGSKYSLGRQLGYFGRSPAASIIHLLNGQKNIPRERFDRLLKILGRSST